MIAGNKIDLVREVDRQEVLDWVAAEMPRDRCVIYIQYVATQGVRQVSKSREKFQAFPRFFDEYFDTT